MFLQVITDRIASIADFNLNLALNVFNLAEVFIKEFRESILESV